MAGASGYSPTFSKPILSESAGQSGVAPTLRRWLSFVCLKRPGGPDDSEVPVATLPDELLDCFLALLAREVDQEVSTMPIPDEASGLAVLKTWATRQEDPQVKRWEISVEKRRVPISWWRYREEFRLACSRDEEGGPDSTGWTPIIHTHTFEGRQTKIFPSPQDLHELAQRQVRPDRKSLHHEGTRVVTRFGIARCHEEARCFVIHFEVDASIPAREHRALILHGCDQLWQRCGGDPRLVVLRRPTKPIYFEDQQGRRMLIYDQ